MRRTASDHAVVSFWVSEKAIRDREWKLLYDALTPTRLYHIDRDPQERWNRIHDRRQTAQALARRMEPYLAVGKRMAPEDEKTLEGLQRLGYLP